MDFKLTEEQQLLTQAIREMGEKEGFKELSAEVDKTGEFPWQLLPKYAEMDLLGMTLSPEYGGQGQSALTAVLAIEELAKFSPMIAGPVFESNVGPVRVVDLFGTDEQKKKIVTGVCKGELSVSVCMTEPEAGCDLTSLATNVVEDGKGYILNGRKIFITGVAKRATIWSIPATAISWATRGSARSSWRKGCPGSASGPRRS